MSPTTDLDQATALLGLDAQWLQPFDVTDPFNADLRLEGFVAVKPDHRYGALALVRVGDRPAPQAIFGTPKLHYPFDREGRFHFPKVSAIRIYEKLDGTNVAAYRYRDADGRLHGTFKLRLHPVLRNGKWGPFLDYWRELVARYPALLQAAERNDAVLSFEMYGARNVHLVVYDPPLEVALLFGVDHDGRPLPPHAIDTLGLPTARCWGELTAADDPVAEYGRIRAAMEASLQHVDEGRLKGSEGTVWYVTRPTGEVVLFKCKPESVEAVHWAGGINKAGVMATCWNVFETADTLTFETLLPLLREEYDADAIERFREHIDACLHEVNEQLAYRNSVLAAYRATGLDLAADKGAVMRELAKVFPRGEMKRVYSVISLHGG
jgi:hypothetical protein